MNKPVIFAQNYNNILNDVIPFYETTTNLLKADKVVLWNDLVSPQKQIVEFAREYSKESIIVEHGMKAVSDYQKGLKDINNQMGGKEFIADKICVWGRKSKEILLEAGVKEEKIRVVGSPVIWNYAFLYISKKDGRIIRLPQYQGKSITDPETKETWDYLDYKAGLPKRNPGKIVVLFAHHDYWGIPKKRNKEVYEKLKHRDDLFVSSSSNYLEDKEDNPFGHFLKMPHEEQKFKIMFLDTRRPLTLQYIKNVLCKARLAITVTPGTLNGICWALDVPVLTPKIDWFWRDSKGKVIYDTHPADYTCNLKDIDKKVEQILKKDTKAKQRKKYAEYFMGTEEGIPLENLRKVIDEH